MPPPAESPPPPFEAGRPASRWALRFSDAVEARYEADTAASRSRELQLAGLIALVIANLFLVNDWMTRPEVMQTAVLWRVGVVTVYGLFVLLWIRTGLLTPRWREAGIASTTVVTMFASCKILEATTSPVAAYDPFTFSLIILAGNVVFRLGFAVAVFHSAAAMLIAALFVFPSPALSAEGKQFAAASWLVTALFTCLACFWLERTERRAYLLILRETERGAVALQAASQFAVLAETDALTQLANRRAFDLELPRRWSAAANRRESIAALLIDIDHFKRFNDRFGHQAGDDCLRQVAELMRGALRDEDFIARIGGEEFAVLLQPTRDCTAAELAERLRSRVEQAGIPHDGQDGRMLVSISLGVALSGPVPLVPPGELIATADAALYQAKRQGRNRWVMASASDTSDSVRDAGQATTLS